MKQNAQTTKKHHSANIAPENSAHIAENAGSSVFTSQAFPVQFDLKSPFKTKPIPSHGTGFVGSSEPGAVSSDGRAGASHASGREFDPLTAHHSRKRFKSISAAGFADYFWQRIHVQEPFKCWPWKGSKNRDGYGTVKAMGKPWIASRMAFILANGYDPAPLLVCHHCDNKGCCNPSHLYAGTKSQNERDKQARSNPKTLKGTLNHFAKLDDAAVSRIRDLIAGGLKNTEIAKRENVHHSTISLIRLGKIWKHVPTTPTGAA